MTRRLIIAIDCDEVLVPTVSYFVTEYNRLYGTNITEEQAYLRDDPAWGADQEEVRRRVGLLFLSEEYAAAEPFADAVRSVKQLARQHELHVVTARHPDIMPVTRRMLDAYFPDCFDTVEHVGIEGDKGEVAKRINADMVIDDREIHLREAQATGIKARVLFGDYPWQGAAYDQEVVTARCRSWAEVEEYIDRYASQ